MQPPLAMNECQANEHECDKREAKTSKYCTECRCRGFTEAGTDCWPRHIGKATTMAIPDDQNIDSEDSERTACPSENVSEPPRRAHCRQCAEFFGSGTSWGEVPTRRVHEL
jgi:hypothetical protein